MTQKDIAFVADFLSEHFSEVRRRDDALVGLVHSCLLTALCFNRMKNSLIGKGSTSMWNELVRSVVVSCIALSLCFEWSCCLTTDWFLFHVDTCSTWRMRTRTLCLHPTRRETSGWSFYRRAHTWRVNYDLFLRSAESCWVLLHAALLHLTDKCLLYPESPLLFPSYPQKSLHFVKRMMVNVIEQCLQKPAVSFLCWSASSFVFHQYGHVSSHTKCIFWTNLETRNHILHIL